jgi:hypothetical protein
MKITTPTPNSTFVITTEPAWPSIVCQTDGSGPHVWNWTMTWKTYKASGTTSTSSNQWDARNDIANLGGQLVIKASAGGQSASVAVNIIGQNPDAALIKTYLDRTPAESRGFDKLLQHETKMRHFDGRGCPRRSFDNGYGMAQLTTPRPTFAEVWNWKLNIDGGLRLLALKRKLARKYLSAKGRTYTDEQLLYETVTRWNGGAYHVWDDKAKRWVRRPNLTCDTQTGNIGWRMTDPENQGKSEQQLHTRDKASYAKPPAADAHWGYSGVCYADMVLR